MQTPLHCYGGAPPPEALAADLNALTGLPAEARRRFFEVLRLTFVDPVPKEVERKIDVFCVEHSLEPTQLASALRAARSIVRGGARYAVSKADLKHDLDALGAEPAAAEVLLAGYDDAYTSLRHRAAVDEIGLHGKLLSGVEWRVDRIMDSKRALRLGVDVHMVTLRYREAGEEKAFTFQVLPDMLTELHEIGKVTGSGDRA